MSAEAPRRLELPIEGMTCATCAMRIEKRLNKLPGVEASVNYATERASVVFDESTISPASLVEAVEQVGYHASLPRGEGAASPAPSVESDPGLADLRRRLVISALLAAPVVALSMIRPLQFDNWQWLALQLATPVAVWGAWPFHRAAIANARHGATTMDTLISLGVLAAFGWSMVALFLLDAGQPGMRMQFHWVQARGTSASEIYLEVSSALTVFLLAGRYFERRAKRRAGAALEALLELGAKEVSILEGEVERRVPVSELRVDTRFVVRPGERIATDGIVEEGHSAIDASLLTGESVPVEVSPGDSVAGATVNAGGRLVVRAIRVGADTALAKIARLVSEAQSGKAPVQRLADRISSVFVPIVIALSMATLLGWLAAGAGATVAFSAAVAVLIIACPCALGLATPTALLVGTGRGAQLGLLIRGPEVLESTRRVDTILLDKTGTVTSGVMSVHRVVAADGEDRDEVLRLAGALEDASEHPIARAIAAAARTAGALQPVQDFQSRAGLGVDGTVGGRPVVVGRPAFVSSVVGEVSAELGRACSEAEAEGRTTVVVAWDGAARGLIEISDTIKPTSAEAVVGLRALGIRPVLLTGDNEATARNVAASVGIDEVFAGVLPSGKADVVRRLQGEGRVVAMVGDGVNDAPALALADLGLAIGTGTDAAIEASDLTLVSGDLRAAVDAIRLARRTLGTIKANLFWAFAYNVAAIPLAILGLLNPLIAGGAMALSSAFVVSNSLRLRRFASSRDLTSATVHGG